jgi:hypothetical protein
MDVVFSGAIVTLYALTHWLIAVLARLEQQP